LEIKETGQTWLHPEASINARKRGQWKGRTGKIDRKLGKGGGTWVIDNTFLKPLTRKGKRNIKEYSCSGIPIPNPKSFPDPTPVSRVFSSPQHH